MLMRELLTPTQRQQLLENLYNLPNLPHNQKLFDNLNPQIIHY
jgi:hypothetical protein